MDIANVIILCIGLSVTGGIILGLALAKVLN